MGEIHKKQIEAAREQLRRLQLDPMDKDRFERIVETMDDMPRLMEAFDLWCRSQEISKPFQATLCAYVIGRNVGEIKADRVRRTVYDWLRRIIDVRANPELGPK